TGPVPQRVAALLRTAPRPPRAAKITAVLLAACALVSATAAADGVSDCHHRIEIAQGEEHT
ncbi:M56 family peptidase, partial [Streptomyces sp. NPDC058045]